MLRPYQKNALIEIRRHFSQGKHKVLLHAPTGSGKTVIFCEVLKGALQKNKKAMLVVSGRKLVEQASNRLSKEGVDHGVIMAGHSRNDPKQDIQICSIDTLRSRKIKPECDILVIDEAHCAISDTYKWLVEKYSGFILAVTATPYPKASLRHIADVVVKPTSFDDLVKQGFLVPPVYFAPVDPDLTKVKVDRSGDYDNKQLSETMSAMPIIGSVVDSWKKFSESRPTIVFCITVQHSKLLCENFIRSGVTCEHLDASSSDLQRKNVENRLISGETKVVCNVGIWAVGVDLPPVSCIVMARPTRSYILYIQQVGRGSRPYNGKKDFIIIDNAGNVMRHGFIENEIPANLDGFESFHPKTISPKTCFNCFAVVSRSSASCTMCGSKFEALPRKIEHVDGTLKKISAKCTQKNALGKEMSDLIKKCKEKNYKQGWVFYQLAQKHGHAKAKIIYAKYYRRLKTLIGT